MKYAFGLAVALAIVPQSWAQEGAAERAGKSLDNAAKSLRRGVENAVDKVSSGVEQKELQTKAYYRIHWDRALTAAAITVETKPDGTVVLKGSVPDSSAKRRAVDLAQSTVGVTAVVDQLVVGKTKAVKVVPTSPETPDREVPPVKNTEIKPAETP